MKKYFWGFGLFLAFTLATFYGCKKNTKEEIIEKPVETITSGSANRDAAGLDITVDSYGFLVIPTTSDLTDFLSFCTSRTHAEVQSYLSNLGFHSLGASLYGEGFQSSIVTNSQVVNYVLDTNKIVRVDHVIFRPIVPCDTCSITKWRFVLTMSPDNLNSTSYGYLAAGYYDSNSMDKFATNPVSDIGNVFDFIANNPTGYEETDENYSVTSRPLLGWGNWSNTTCSAIPKDNWIDQNNDGIPDPTYSQCRKRKFYIIFSVDSETECSLSYSCN